MENYERLTKLRRKKEKIDKEIASIENKIGNAGTDKKQDDQPASQATVPLHVYEELSKKYKKLKRKYRKSELERSFSQTTNETEENAEKLSRLRTGSVGQTANHSTALPIFSSEDEDEEIHLKSITKSITKSISAFETGPEITEISEKDGLELDQDYSQEISQDINGKVTIMASSLKQLVNRIAGSTTLDANFARDFLLTYRYFTTSDELLSLLIERFKCEPSPDSSESMRNYFNQWRGPIRFRVINVIKKWIDTSFEDFKNDEKLMEKLKTFVHDKIATSEFKKWTESILAAFAEPEPVPVTLPSKSVLKKRHSMGNPTTLGDIPSRVLATQLTIFERKMFTKITPAELQSGAWNNAKKADNAPNILALTRWFNKLSYWLASETIKPDIKARVKALCKWIEVADYCKQINNFSTMMCILATLGLSSLLRLKRTWKELPDKFKEMHSQLEELMSSAHNYKNYRAKLDALPRPIQPYLGIFFRDLLFIEEGNPNTSQRGLINFAKMRMVANVISTIQDMQKKEYDFQEVTEIQFFLSNPPESIILTEDALYEYSKACEPIPKHNAKEEKDKIQIPRRKTDHDLPQSTFSISLDFATIKKEILEKLKKRPSLEELQAKNIIRVGLFQESTSSKSIEQTVVASKKTKRLQKFSTLSHSSPDIRKSINY